MLAASNPTPTTNISGVDNSKKNTATPTLPEYYYYYSHQSTKLTTSLKAAINEASPIKAAANE